MSGKGGGGAKGGGNLCLAQPAAAGRPGPPQHDQKGSMVKRQIGSTKATFRMKEKPWEGNTGRFADARELRGAGSAAALARPPPQEEPPAGLRTAPRDLSKVKVGLPDGPGTADGSEPADPPAAACPAQPAAPAPAAVPRLRWRALRAFDKTTEGKGKYDRPEFLSFAAGELLCDTGEPRKGWRRVRGSSGEGLVLERLLRAVSPAADDPGEQPFREGEWNEALSVADTDALRRRLGLAPLRLAALPAPPAAPEGSPPPAAAPAETDPDSPAPEEAALLPAPSRVRRRLPGPGGGAPPEADAAPRRVRLRLPDGPAGAGQAAEAELQESAPGPPQRPEPAENPPEGAAAGEAPAKRRRLRLPQHPV
eukprot:TRINITY_DN4653_c0_g1_i2.p2 TRINITY_DN4653_c0_g1~~TRINITY_DN4653_c0_g1_i2.p2  ORF type:complete len:389 (+),score=100.87 TRINITY_DN4653_c0_g1_i2:72-1169(+)